MRTGGDGDDEMIRSCYEPLRPRWRQPLTDPAVVGMTVAVVAGARSAMVPAGLVVGAFVVVLVRSVDVDVARWMLVLVLLAGGAAGHRGAAEREALAPRALGPFDGWVQLVGDPRPVVSHGRSAAVRSIVRVDGQRYEVWSRDAGERTVMAQMQGGQWIHVSGRLRPLSPRRAEQVAWQHVVGVLQVQQLGAVAEGSRMASVTNEVRRAVERGSAQLPAPHDALFRGLVIGDRAGQPPEMTERFRSSGLSHLTVVSGLNVALVLVLVAPLLRRLRPWWRWAATVGVVFWFAALTRFEPSVMRAGAMAALAATAFVSGRDRSPARLLCVAVILLVLIDPLLVHAVGFWLSVGATAGVCTVGPWLTARLAHLGPLAAPIGVTVGAQVGVALPLTLTFGTVPLVSVPANLVAVPVASAVKLYGLPASIVAGWAPPLADPLMWPCRIGVVWVDQVAVVAAGSEPGGVATVVGWVLLAAALAAVIARYRVVDGGAPPHR